MTKAPLCRFCKVRHYGNCNDLHPRNFDDPAMPEQSRDVIVDMDDTLGNRSVTKIASVVTKIGRGRPKRYENAAAKQKAYRARKK